MRSHWASISHALAAALYLITLGNKPRCGISCQGSNATLLLAALLTRAESRAVTDYVWAPLELPGPLGGSKSRASAPMHAPTGRQSRTR